MNSATVMKCQFANHKYIKCALFHVPFLSWQFMFSGKSRVEHETGCALLSLVEAFLLWLFYSGKLFFFP